MDELVPIGITQLPDIHAEGDEQILRVPRREPALGKARTQSQAFRIGITGADEACASFSSGARLE
jgi:hypothetical protein